MFRNCHDKIYVSKILKHISYHLLFKDGQKENNIFSFVIPYCWEGLTMTATKAISGEKNYIFPKRLGYRLV